MAHKSCMTALDIVGAKLALAEERGRKRGLSLVSYPQSPISSLETTIEDLLQRDKRRETDGFPKKIKFRSVLVAPGKIISVPYVEEEKLIHGEFEPKSDEEGKGGDEGNVGDLGERPGSGEGQVGDVIGNIPIRGGGEDGEGDEGDEDGGDPQAGSGSGEHGAEEEVYQKGKELLEKFKLPNLRDKGKKVPTEEYTYDLTDRHRGSGQVLDKKETLKSIVQTNITLGRIDKDNIDTAKLIVGPHDKIYRVLSREKVWKSQAVVFFARDYSGSMFGAPTEAVISQHLMIYAWLLVQYEKLVIPRFFVHDTEAREVSIKDYFSLMAGGGTSIPSVYKEITKTVEGEGLARDYNIFVFEGTDGDDFDDGREAIPEIEKILGYVNRMGVSVLKHPHYGDRATPFEEYVEEGGFLERRDLFRVHVMSSEGVTDDKNIEAIKSLIGQD